MRKPFFVLPRSPLLIVLALTALSAPIRVCGDETESEATATQASKNVDTDKRFQEVIVPFLAEHCLDCHSGDEPEAQLGLDQYEQSANVQSDYERWEKIRRALVERQMPPSDHPQPTQKDVLTVIDEIDSQLETFDCSASEHPGRVTIRRLNRVEYNNTIRDLIGLPLTPADDFPSDDVGNGFDNMGDVLTISPILMEKYVAAARQITEAAFADEKAKARILIEKAETDEELIVVAKNNIRAFAERAFRRPVEEDEVDRLFRLMFTAWQQGSDQDEIFQTAVIAVLASPNFLFRVERDPDPDDEDRVRELDDFEIATRLSYFLWSSMPDEELFDLARKGKLTDHEVLASQVKRMLGDPKSDAIVKNFAGQWLQLRDVEVLQPDPEKFAGFDDGLRSAMRGETEMFFQTVMRENLSVLSFLDADFTFVNERLAKHYGMTGVSGEEFRRVSSGEGRRGVLTHASILMLTSNPTRTSPVKRGKWILDNILGEPPPPPPPDVPELDEDSETFGSLREQMQQHRSNESCAVCHRKMDALGFGLENFDAVGSWREKDGRFEIDPAGKLPGGRSFQNAAELMTILADEKKNEFCRCLIEKMLTYALGRSLDSYDRCTVKGLQKSLQEDGFRFQSLVTGIVTSEPFLLREAPREE